MDDAKMGTEISLKQIMVYFIKYWKMMFAIVFTGAAISIVYSFFIAEPVYQSRIEMFMSFPDEIETEVGLYKYFSTNPHDYFALIENSEIVEKTLDTNPSEFTKTGFSSNLKIYKEKDSGVVKITLKGKDPEKIAKILDNHTDNYEKYLVYNFKKDAINQFMVETSVEISLKEEALELSNQKIVDLENKLAELSPTILLERKVTAQKEENVNVFGNFSLTGVSNDTSTEEVLNSNYVQLQSTYIEAKNVSKSLEIEISELINKNELLNKEKQILENSGIFEEPKNDFLSILSTPIKSVAQAKVPLNRISPKRTFNVLIAVLISLIIGSVCIVLKAYWDNN